MSLLRMLGIGAPPVPAISVSEAHEGRVAGKYILVDVRAPQEWNATGRPQGAEGVALQDPNFLARITALAGEDKSAPIAMTCRSGNRSGMIVRQLRKAGFENAINVKGGIIAWKAAVLPLASPPF